MGRPKALLAAGATTFAGAIAETARAAGVSEIVVVVGPPHGAAIVAALPPGARAAWNPDPSRGMLTSIQAGIAALQHVDAAMQHEVTAALVWPVDLPLVRVETVRALLAAPPGRLAALQHGATCRGGHPVLVPRALFAELLALPTEAGLRALMQAHADTLVRVTVDDPGVIEDIDTEDDYRRHFPR